MYNTLVQRISRYIRSKFNSNSSLQLQLISLGVIQELRNKISSSEDDQKAPKVSVIMPTYNRSGLLKKAIESYLRQSYKNSELIVLNNGSTDNTQSVLSEYKDRIITINRSKNKIQDALNVLWEASSGDLICPLFDDDEFYDENSISLRVNEFMKNELTEVVYAGVMLRGSDGKNRLSIPGESPSPVKLLQKEYINLTSMMWKRSIKDKFMFDEDFEFNLDSMFKIRCLMECSVTAIKQPVMSYAVHEDQETRRMHHEGKYDHEKKMLQQKINKLYGKLFF